MNDIKTFRQFCRVFFATSRLHADCCLWRYGSAEQHRLSAEIQELSERYTDWRDDAEEAFMTVLDRLFPDWAKGSPEQILRDWIAAYDSAIDV
jgi:hypothetical protein